MTTAVLFALPSLFLLLALLAGRFPGERAIERARRTRTRRRRHVARVPARRLHVVVPPRGGLLVAAALASRPPPARVA